MATGSVQSFNLNVKCIYRATTDANVIAPRNRYNDPGQKVTDWYLMSSGEQK